MPWHWWICCQWTRVTRELITQVKTYSLCDPCGSNIIHRRRLKFSVTPTSACSETFSTRTVISSFNFSSHVWIIPVDVPLQQTPTENYHRDSNPVSKVASSIQVQIVQYIKKRDDPGMEMFIQETKKLHSPIVVLPRSKGWMFFPCLFPWRDELEQRGLEGVWGGVQHRPRR